jgi:hydrogenase maturation protease
MRPGATSRAKGERVSATAAAPVAAGAARIVIIGCGNPLRSDDAVGQLAAEALAEALDDPRVLVLPCHGLLPEMSEPLSRCELAVFIDATVAAAPGVVQRESIEPPAQVSLSQMHHLTPPVLLTCTRRLFKRCPEALVYGIGIQSIEHGQGLTPAVQRALGRVVKQVRLVVRRRLKEPAAAGASEGEREREGEAGHA